MDTPEALQPPSPEADQAREEEKRRRVEALITGAPHGLVGLVYDESCPEGSDWRAKAAAEFKAHGFHPHGDTLATARQVLHEAPVLIQDGKERIIDLSKLTYASYTALRDEQNGPQAHVSFGRGLQLDMRGMYRNPTFMFRDSPDADLMLLSGFRADALLTALYAAGVNSVISRGGHNARSRIHEIRYPHVDPDTGKIIVSIIKMDTHYASALAACLENHVVANRGRL